ncbi:MAG: hypothetical protein OEZ54_11520, partial [Gemmatimonadota bacterium]|nr:hypothetical protein [Gemmatimonadota bacterium]
VAITTAMTVDSAGFIPGVLILPALGATVLNNLIAVPQPDSYALKPQPILAPGPNGRTMFGVGFAF